MSLPPCTSAALVLDSGTVMVNDSLAHARNNSDISDRMSEDLKYPRVRRKVSFQECRREIPVPSFACLSEEERRKIWHVDADIEGFKANARQLVERQNIGTHQEENLRGLELRLSQERQARKYMILQAILRAQKRCKDPKQLSSIARKCSVWSKTAAIIEAHRDFCSIYDPARISAISSIPSMDEYPLPFKSKTPCRLSLKRPISPLPRRCVRQRPAEPSTEGYAMSC